MGRGCVYFSGHTGVAQVNRYDPIRMHHEAQKGREGSTTMMGARRLVEADTAYLAQLATSELRQVIVYRIDQVVKMAAQAVAARM